MSFYAGIFVGLVLYGAVDMLGDILSGLRAGLQTLNEGTSIHWDFKYTYDSGGTMQTIWYEYERPYGTTKVNPN